MCSSHFPLAKPVFCFSSFLHLNCRALELVLFLILSTLKPFPDWNWKAKNTFQKDDHWFTHFCTFFLFLPISAACGLPCPGLCVFRRLNNEEKRWNIFQKIFIGTKLTFPVAEAAAVGGKSIAIGHVHRGLLHFVNQLFDCTWRYR